MVPRRVRCWVTSGLARDARETTLLTHLRHQLCAEAVETKLIFCAGSGAVLVYRERGRGPLFDNLVGAAERGQRERNTERLGGLEVDDELERDRLNDRQVGGLSCERVLLIKMEWWGPQPAQ
jgi:hypothetical protein